MSFSLLPRLITDELTDLTPDFLHARGIKLLMLDFDNTIVPYTTDEPTEKMAAWVRKMQQTDIQLCVVSNSRNSRVQAFCRRFDLPCITRAHKPGSRGIRECLTKYHTPAAQAALVGDQIYTDTLGANLADVTSILVRAIHNHNIWLKLRHAAEMPFIFLARNRRIKT